MLDLWTLFHHSLNARDNEAETSSFFSAWMITIILLIVAAYWMIRHKHGLSRSLSSASSAKKQQQGDDSPFYQLQQQLQLEGRGPQKNETLRQWLYRLESIKGHGLDLASLRQIMALHYRYRFGSGDMGSSLKSEIQNRVSQWLDQHPRARNLQ